MHEKVFPFAFTKYVLIRTLLIMMFMKPTMAPLRAAKTLKLWKKTLQKQFYQDPLTVKTKYFNNTVLKHPAINLM